MEDTEGRREEKEGERRRDWDVPSGPNKGVSLITSWVLESFKKMFTVYVLIVFYGSNKGYFNEAKSFAFISTDISQVRF